jgi:hypothetical protein
VVLTSEDALADGESVNQLDLVEGKVLGGGAFSRVSKVVEETNSRAYALKRMRKAVVLQCPEHVFCEQIITRNTAHPFCIRQVCILQKRIRFCRVQHLSCHTVHFLTSSQVLNASYIPCFLFW